MATPRLKILSRCFNICSRLKTKLGTQRLLLSPFEFIDSRRCFLEILVSFDALNGLEICKWVRWVPLIAAVFIRYANEAQARLQRPLWSFDRFQEGWRHNSSPSFLLKAPPLWRCTLPFLRNPEKMKSFSKRDFEKKMDGFNLLFFYQFDFLKPGFRPLTFFFMPVVNEEVTRSFWYDSNRQPNWRVKGHFVAIVIPCISHPLSFQSDSWRILWWIGSGFSGCPRSYGTAEISKWVKGNGSGQRLVGFVVVVDDDVHLLTVELRLSFRSISWLIHPLFDR